MKSMKLLLCLLLLSSVFGIKRSMAQDRYYGVFVPNSCGGGNGGGGHGGGGGGHGGGGGNNGGGAAVAAASAIPGLVVPPGDLLSVGTINPLTGAVTDTSATHYSNPDSIYFAVGMNSFSWVYGINNNYDIASYNPTTNTNGVVTNGTGLYPANIYGSPSSFGLGVDNQNMAWVSFAAYDTATNPITNNFTFRYSNWLSSFTTATDGSAANPVVRGRLTDVSGNNLPSTITDLAFDNSGNGYFIGNDGVLYYATAATLAAANGGNIPLQTLGTLTTSAPFNVVRSIDGIAFTSAGKLMIIYSEINQTTLTLKIYLNTYTAPGAGATVMPLSQVLLNTITNFSGCTPIYDIASNVTPLVVLPVSFGNIRASLSGNNLHVNWTTETETNNDHFEIEAAADGKTFTQIGAVKSRAAGGNSNAVLDYSFSTDKYAGSLMMSGSILAMLALGMGFVRRKFAAAGIAAMLSFVLLVTGCSKGRQDVQSAVNGKIYIRIAQVDIDGKKSYSKVVLATKE